MNMARLVRPLSFLLLAILITSILSLCIGSFWLSPLDTVRALLPSANDTNPRSIQEQIIISIRLPRLLTALIVGAALAAAGAIFQSVIRNPLGDPFLLGVSSGAALGMVLAMSLGIGGYLAGIPIAALVGGLTAILVVYILAKSGGKIHTTRLILAGIVVSSYGSALTMLILARSESATVRGITFWMMGDLSYHGLSDLAMLFPMAAIIIFIIFTFSGKLNVLILGDDVARQLGLPVEFLKLIAIFAASLLTGLAVAAAGVVGFVGLVVPNLVRFIWGSDFRMNFILSTFSGALLVSGADIIVKLITPVSQLPIGIVTALIGAPFFIYLLVSARD